MHFLSLTKGRYTARLARTADEVRCAQRLRYRSFIAQRGLVAQNLLDVDDFDAACQHMLVEHTQSGALVACFRFQTFANGADLNHSYSSQYYDLTKLNSYLGVKLELGRFCLHPEWHESDILRLAWGALTQIVDASGCGLLFGCTSLMGAQVALHQQTLANLAQFHLGPDQWRPSLKSPDIYRLAQAVQPIPSVARDGLVTAPPLLRTYLAMGGWVSDHAVIDTVLDTLHVFTAVEVAKIPPARARALRQISQNNASQTA